MTRRSTRGLAAAAALAGVAGGGLILSGGGSATPPGNNGILAFVSTRDDANGDVYTMAATPGAPGTRLAPNAAADGAPSFTADGSSILFYSGRGLVGATGVFRMSSTGESPVRVGAVTGDNPVISPDGSTIVYSSGGELYRMNADGSNVVRLTNDAVFDTKPAWSPDSRRIAWQTRRDGGDWEIWTMNPDGTGAAQITNDPTGASYEPDWSPDGAKIVFGSTRVGPDSEIWTVNATGGGLSQLTANDFAEVLPAWSPDGAKIAFTSARDGNNEIYVMNADGTGQTRLTTNAASDYSPSWQPLKPAVTPPPPPPPPPPAAVVTPPAPKAPGRVSSRVRFGVTFPKGGFRVTILTAFELTRSARVRVRCAKGCKVNAVKLVKGTTSNLQKSFGTRVLPLGSRIEVRVTKAGLTGRYYLYTVTRGKVKVKQCRIAAGGTRLSACTTT